MSIQLFKKFLMDLPENERCELQLATEQGPVPEAAGEGWDGGVVLQRGEEDERGVDAAEGRQVQLLQDRQRVGGARSGKASGAVYTVEFRPLSEFFIPSI